jgi:O-acetyl-ADP-ribose deacetylase
MATEEVCAMNCCVKKGDILDVDSDALICSANPYLNLSGGVGGTILVRFGDEMQKALRRYLVENDLTYVSPGGIVSVPPCGTPFRHVVHAVAVDSFYDSSPALVGDVVRKALALLGGLGVRSVALAALATGFGRLTMGEFATGILPVLSEEFGSVTQVTVCVLDEAEALEIEAVLKNV